MKRHQGWRKFNDYYWGPNITKARLNMLATTAFISNVTETKVWDISTISVYSADHSTLVVKFNKQPHPLVSLSKPANPMRHSKNKTYRKTLDQRVLGRHYHFRNMSIRIQYKWLGKVLYQGEEHPHRNAHGARRCQEGLGGGHQHHWRR